MLPILISVKELCRLLSIGRTKAFEMIHKGSVQSFLEGGRRLIVLESVFRYLEERGYTKADLACEPRHQVERLAKEEAAEDDSSPLRQISSVSENSHAPN